MAALLMALVVPMLGSVAPSRQADGLAGVLTAITGPRLATSQSLEPPELLEVEPADSSTVAVAPLEVRLEFSEPVLALLNGSSLNDAAGAEVPVRITVDNARTTVRFVILSELPEGEYQVNWEVRSDGDQSARGTTAFTFNADTEPEPEQTATATPDIADDARPYRLPATIARSLGWLLAASAVGIFAYLAAVQRGGLDEMRRLVIILRRLGLLLIIAAIVETLLLAIGDGRRLGAALDWEVLTDVFSSAGGLALVLRALGGLILALGSYEAAKPIDPVTETSFLEPATDPRSLAPRDAVRLHVVRVPVAIAGAAMLVISMVWLAASEGPRRGPVGFLALAAHHVAAALWLGVGCGLVIVCGLRLGKGRSLRRGSIVSGGAQLAGAGLLLAVIAGLIAAVGRLDGLGDLFSTGLGRSYLIKIVLSAAAAALLTQLNHRARAGALTSTNIASRESAGIVAGWRVQMLLGVLAAVIGVIGAMVLL